MARLPDLIEFARDARPQDRRDRRPHPLPQPHRAAGRAHRRAPARRRAHGAFRLVVYRDKLSDATHLALVRGPIVAGHRDAGARARAAVGDGPARRRQRVALVEHPGGARRRSPRRAAASSCCCTGPRAPQELRAPRDRRPSRRVSRKMDLRNYGIGAQILRDLNVGRMRLLAKPRKMPSMTGFDLEVTGYVEPPPRAGVVTAARAAPHRPAMPIKRIAPTLAATAAASASCCRASTPAIGDGLLAGALRALARGRRRRRATSPSSRCPARWRRRSRCSGSRSPATTTRWSRWARSIRGETYHFEIVANESAARRVERRSSSSASRSATAS